MPLVACPECYRQISDRASACPQCGFPRPAALAPSASADSSSRADVTAAPAILLSPLYEIAYRQKLLLYGVLINLLSQFPVWYFLATPALSGLGTALAFANAGYCLWSFYKLGRALKMPRILIAFYSVGLLVPGLGLLVMLVFVSRATRALQQAGVRVGLLGADLSKVL